MTLEPLPIDAFIEDIVSQVRHARAMVLTAQPGAGKTTRVPPALLEDGPLILLQPRRVAARSIARRIAAERGWTIGREIGWHIRFERQFTNTTRLLVATEGVLTERLQRDPLLSDFRTIVIDEFHERSISADLALALAKQAWLARDDLRIVVMSATLETDAVSSFLDDCPAVDVPGRLFPIDIQYRPQTAFADVAVEALNATSGGVLCFFPGAREIRRATVDLQAILGRDVDVVPLYGALDAAEQDLALTPSPRRRVVVATNIAETSVTVPGVTGVVDSGLHRVGRYDAARGIDSLELERIPADSAEQRSGRAGRLSPGVVWRLWDPTDRLRPHREPEIHRVDLSALVLDVMAWGGDPRTLDWFEHPRGEALDAAEGLLDRLGAVAEGRLTALGEQMRRLPVHPRLARMLVASGGAQTVARACAMLSERYFMPVRPAATSSDLLSAIDAWQAMPSHVQEVARQIERLSQRALDVAPGRSARVAFSDVEFRMAVLAGYPDRVAQRREPMSPRVRLASGTGGSIGRESGVVDGEFLVAVDVQSGSGPTAPGRSGDAIIRIASRIEREWLEPTHSQVVHRFDSQAGVVRAMNTVYYGALVLAEHPAAADPAVVAGLLAEAWGARGPRSRDQQLLRRLRFSGQTMSLDELVLAAAHMARSLDDVDLARALPPAVARALQVDAPESLRLPSGRLVALEYAEDGTVMAAAKLQELFGLGETPRIGKTGAPVLFSLLAPNGRPVQLTRDLRSFWERTYPEVRKELRGRYPKHPWPEDPWTARATAMPLRRASKGHS